MWIKREFDWVGQWEHDKGAGWRPKNFPELDPVTEFGVAHDAMEHFCFGDTLDNEGLAFGVILWGREGGAWHPWLTNPGNKHFADILAADAAEFICIHGSVPPTEHGTEPLEEEWAEHQLRLWRPLIKEMMNEGGDGFARVYGYDLERADEDIEMLIRWTRRGFLRAEQRIGVHMSAYDWITMFDEVSNHPLVAGRFEPGSENDKLIVEYNLEAQEVRVRLDEYVDPYY